MLLINSAKIEQQNNHFPNSLGYYFSMSMMSLLNFSGHEFISLQLHPSSRSYYVRKHSINASEIILWMSTRQQLTQRQTKKIPANTEKGTFSYTRLSFVIQYTIKILAKAIATRVKNAYTASIDQFYLHIFDLKQRYWAWREEGQ